MAGTVDAKSWPWWQACATSSSVSLLGELVPSTHQSNFWSSDTIIISFLFILKIKVQHSRALVEPCSILVVCVPCAGRFVARLVLHPAALPKQSLHNAEMLCLE